MLLLGGLEAWRYGGMGAWRFGSMEAGGGNHR